MILQTDEEIKNLFFYLWRTKDIRGDVIEVGVFRGGSAEILDMMKGGRPLFLYDTFEDNHEGFDDLFDQSMSEQVFSRFPNVIKGKVTTGNHQLISFAHLDVDGENGTLEAIEYLYPRLNNGGVIVCHDYQNPHLKVKEVIDKFMFYKPEKPIPLTGTSQCVIIKQ